MKRWLKWLFFPAQDWPKPISMSIVPKNHEIRKRYKALRVDKPSVDVAELEKLYKESR